MATSPTPVAQPQPDFDLEHTEMKLMPSQKDCPLLVMSSFLICEMTIKKCRLVKTSKKKNT